MEKKKHVRFETAFHLINYSRINLFNNIFVLHDIFVKYFFFLWEGEGVNKVLRCTV